jgi:glucose/arabinose dehydrogenase
MKYSTSPCGFIESLEPRTLFATFPAGFTATFRAGISGATAMAFAPDGSLWVAQQGGQLRVIRQGTLVGTPAITLSVDSNGERGLLGIAFDPDFSSNHYIYLYHTVPGSPPHNRVSRFTIDPANPNVVPIGTETPILDLDNLSTATNHNGGAIHFGADGKLYVSVGENANGANAQTFSNRLGKMLRINSDGSIPTDNPFFNTATGLNRSIWAMGLRNPFTFAIDPASGLIHIDDVGEVTWEEINVGQAGKNYGWNTIEGKRTTQTPPDNYMDPLIAYPHSGGDPTFQGTAIIGGSFYRPPAGGGGAFPSSYDGDYFFGDYGGGWLRTLDAGTADSTLFGTGIATLIDTKVGYDGSLYYVQRGNTAGVYRVRYTDTTRPTVSASFHFDDPLPSNNPHQLQYIFSEYVGDTLTPADLTLQNLTTGQTIPTSSIALDYDAASHTAHFHFSGDTLPDGNYRATLTASGVADNSGNALLQDDVFNFFVLTGDANHDGRVNALDFNTLASNFGVTNATFSQGNFNYDGVVNTLDFNLLASKFGSAAGAAAVSFSNAPIQPARLFTDQGSSSSKSNVRDVL